MKTLPVALLVLLALVAGVVGVVGTAAAASQYVSVPATAFVLTGNTTYLSSFGAIEGDSSNVVRAPVYLNHGLNICRFDMAAHDFADPANVTARLVRKLFGPDGDLSFGRAPVTIAEVSSDGFDNALRVFSTSTISAPLVRPSYMYWVEILWAGGPIQVTGLRIFAATTCPAP